MTTKAVLYLFAFLGVSLVCGDLELLPQNAVHYEGDIIVLTCRVAEAGPEARVMWTEFTTSIQGSVISDNRNILLSHPNAARYEIVGSGFDFNLQIINTTMFDGGQYLCQDIQGSPPAKFRGSAEIVILRSDPVCTDFPSVTGALVEGRLYGKECEVYYMGNIVPHMNWTGVGDFDTSRAITETSVWTMVSLIADREMAGGEFICTTAFYLPDNIPPEGATNTPDYLHLSPSVPVVIHWGPVTLDVTPIKEFYVSGDVLTCTADSNPTSTFRWTNMRTLEVEPTGVHTFTITPELEGFDQVMRCQAGVIIEGSLFSNDIFVNVSVPAVTTPTTPTTPPMTTTPPLDAPCTNPTGQWSSTNPNALLCVEVDAKGNVLTLLRNGTDPFFVAGNGKTVVNDYRHLGFTGVWPPGDKGGAAGYTGECHRCSGNEVILLSGLYRNKRNSPGCGLTAGTELTKLYVLTRYGPPCRGLDAKVYRPSPEHIQHFGINEKNIIL